MGWLGSIFGRGEARALVVRRRAPALRIILWLAALLIGAFGVYVVYELGRYNAGYDRQAVAQQRTELEVQIEHLQKDNRDLRTRLAELDTIRLGRAREQSEVARSIGDLQAQVARQAEEAAHQLFDGSHTSGAPLHRVPGQGPGQGRGPEAG